MLILQKCLNTFGIACNMSQCLKNWDLLWSLSFGPNLITAMCATASEQFYPTVWICENVSTMKHVLMDSMPCDLCFGYIHDFEEVT